MEAEGNETDQRVGQRQPGLGAHQVRGYRSGAGVGLASRISPSSGSFSLPPTLYPCQRLSSLPEQDVVTPLEFLKTLLPQGKKALTDNKWKSGG